jgi:glutamate formiminotransferase/formiminotetrahydrofolate cyclodeaminase
VDQTRLIECVANFSEGRDLDVLAEIASAIRSVESVRLLHVDPDRDTNRTVMTFAGAPEAVVEAAFRAARGAQELIDMSRHTGAHPRFGALDVCPLVPIGGMTMEETIEWSRLLARRMGDELELTVFLYGLSATSDARQNLAEVRAGGYEGLKTKLLRPEWKPDFGSKAFNARSGATAVGARDFLVAYNVNLDTASKEIADRIAYSIRESGNPRLGIKRGTLPGVRAIGWFLPERRIAQVSMNLINLASTSLYESYEETRRQAEAQGVKVTGSEVIGLVPLKAILDAGEHYGAHEADAIDIAIKALGLRDFDPKTRILEYAIANAFKA